MALWSPPNVPRIMEKAFAVGMIPSLHCISYYLEREALIIRR